jgi:hypothetical protein
MTDDLAEPPLTDGLPRELAPPPALRATTLAAVARARRRRRWGRGTGLAIAAGLLLVVATSLTPREKRAGDVPGGASILLAAERARQTLDALDAAERELRDALIAAPDDRELLARLATLRDRRDAIHRLVREAAS